MSRVAESFSDALRRDLDHGRGFPWLVVFYAAGIWLYFELPREPQLWATTTLALGLGVLCRRLRNTGHAATGTLIAASIAAGLATADFRTWFVEAPRLAREQTYEVTGWVEAVEPRATGFRLTVQPTHLSRLPQDAWPERIRVTGRTGEVPLPGAAVSFLARLSPPQGPVLPGGYAFDRAAYFERIGGFGFIYGGVKDAAPRDLPSFALQLRAGVSAFRGRIGARIRDTIPGDAGAIAAALIVGDRGAVSEEAQENLRIAGLAHVLAISGMHMALVAGAIFFAVRAGLALSPALALTRPIRSWAAAAALLAATAYLILSGASIATQRAYVMAAVIFIAMIAGRPALTMRSVALAAAIVLAMTPEALLQPGFQMSFAAVIALVSTYRAWFEARKRRKDDGREPEAVSLGARVGRLLIFWIGGLAMTSLIAGLATGPIALSHFYRASPLGLVANMAAMPLVSILIMPAAVAGVLAMPFGLDPLALLPMALGIDGMLAIAERVASWTPGGGIVGAIGRAPAIAFTVGLLWMALWSSRWRFLGLAPMLLAIPLAVGVRHPDILVSDDGRTLAFREETGSLAVSLGPGGAFTAEIWLRADGDAASLKTRRPGPQAMRCDPAACVFRIPRPDGGRDLILSRVERPEAFLEDCRRADVIVSGERAPPGCADHALVLDAATLARSGATALYLTSKPDRVSDRTGVHPGGGGTRSVGATVSGPAGNGGTGEDEGGIEHTREGAEALMPTERAPDNRDAERRNRERRMTSDRGPPSNADPPAWLARIETARTSHPRPWESTSADVPGAQ